MKKFMTPDQAIKQIKDGDMLMVGGFLQCGSPETLIRALKDNSDAKNLTVVSNDTGTMSTNMIRLMETGRITHVYASYIGANTVTSQMLLDNPKSVTLVPQGTLAERVRAGGAGLGGILTPVGVGTVVEEGKQKITIDGRDYLLETALKGNVALIHATKADGFGNCFMRGATKNFNVIMAMSADYVIVEAEEIVEVGGIDTELISVSGIFVDAIVKAVDL